MRIENVLVGAAFLATALAQAPAYPQAVQNPPDPSSSESRPPTQEHLGRGTVDDVSPQPVAPKVNPDARNTEKENQSVTFEIADYDKNGRIDRGEASGISGLDFMSADRDGDASLSKQEFQTAIAKPK
jgi:hypothetical protein